MRAATRVFAGGALAAVLVVAGVVAPASAYKNDEWNSARLAYWQVTKDRTLEHGQTSTIAFSNMYGFAIGIQAKQVIRGTTVIGSRVPGNHYVSVRGDRINQHRSSY